MASIAKLVVSLGANIAGFETDMARASANQKRRMKQMEREAQDAARAVGVVFTASVAAMTAMVVKSTAVADSMQKMALRTGISTEALSKYSLVAELADVEMESFVKSISKMQRSLVDANNGLATQQRAFDRLGLSVSDLLQMSPEEQFDKISGALADLESATLRSATAQEIFGRAGTALLPMLAGGAKAMAEAKKEAESFNLVISQNFADSSAQFNDNMLRMDKLTMGTSNAFTEGILPALLDVQSGILGMNRNFDAFRVAGEKVGAMLKVLATAFVVVKEAALLFGRVLLGSVMAVLGAMKAVIYPTIGLVNALAEAFRALAAGDFSGATAAVASVPTKIAQEFTAAIDQVKTASGFLAEQFTDDIPAAIARVNKFFNTNAAVVASTADSYGDMADQTKAATTAMKAWTDRQRIASKSIEENLKFVEELEQAHEAYNQQLQDFIDIGDPVAALVRDFQKQVDFANKALAAGKITADQYRASLNALSNQLGQAAAGFQQTANQSEVWTEALLESVRILERSFTSAWESVVDGSQSAFEGILDGFKTMLASMLHQLTTAPLIRELEKLFQPGGPGIGGLGGLFKSDTFKNALGGLAGVFLGSAFGGGGSGAGIGASIGAALGSFIPGLGNAIGAAIGGILGGLVGGLFDSNRPPVLQVSGRSNAALSSSDDDNTINSVFGTTFLRSRRLDAAAIAEFSNALKEFDTTIASFLDDSQVAAIADSLKDWSVQIASETLTAEQILNSRFAAMLSTFSDDLQVFVNQAEGLEERVARLQVGTAAEKLFAENAALFGNRTLPEFLAVIDAIADRTKTVTEAFQEVATALGLIDVAQKAIREFADSNFVADYERFVRLQNETPVDTFSRLSVELFDAVAAFDNTPEKLFAIADMFGTIEQAAITAVAHIDAAWKGLSANLDKLRADILDTIAGPKSERQIFEEAAGLVDLVKNAQTPEEITALGSQFESLLRQLSPETIARLGPDIVRLVDQFRSEADTSFARVRELAVNTAESLRQMADAFLTRIPDALTLLAATNERVAAALEALSGTAVTVPGGEEIDPIGDVVVPDLMFAEALEDQSQILLDGTNLMAAALRSGTADLQSNIAAAIQAGFRGANVTVHVTMAPDSLVTQ